MRRRKTLLPKWRTGSLDKLEEAELDIRNQFLMSMFRPKPVKSEWAKEGTYPKSGKPTKTGVWSFDYRYGC